jgi:hypothetical protein
MTQTSPCDNDPQLLTSLRVFNLIAFISQSGQCVCVCVCPKACDNFGMGLQNKDFGHFYLIALRGKKVICFYVLCNISAQFSLHGYHDLLGQPHEDNDISCEMIKS